jgi:hypothetical protein
MAKKLIQLQMKIHQNPRDQQCYLHFLQIEKDLNEVTQLESLLFLAQNALYQSYYLEWACMVELTS